MSLIPWRQKREERMMEEGGMGAPLARFRNEMDNLFERFFGETWGPGLLESLPARMGFGPRIDLAESENEITMRAELPGVDPNDVNVEVMGNTLTIRGEKKQQKEEKRENYHYVERQYGTFNRRVELPSSVDPNRVNAAFKNGLLTITMAKRPDAKAKRITVKPE
jgi:HSP20 family protein